MTTNGSHGMSSSALQSTELRLFGWVGKQQQDAGWGPDHVEKASHIWSLWSVHAAAGSMTDWLLLLCCLVFWLCSCKCCAALTYERAVSSSTPVADLAGVVQLQDNIPLSLLRVEWWHCRCHKQHGCSRMYCAYTAGQTTLHAGVLQFAQPGCFAVAEAHGPYMG